MYYAHSTQNPDKSDWQPLKDHLRNVAILSKDFASDFNAGDLAYISGLFHDLGKYSYDFQNRLEGKNIRVDHSTAGAKEVRTLFHDDLEQIGILPAYIIAGHHGGLINYGSTVDGLCERLRRTDVPNFTAYQNDLHLEPFTTRPFKLASKRKSTGFCFSFFTRMLYSCLVDADSLDTEAFTNPEKSHTRGK